MKEASGSEKFEKCKNFRFWRNKIMRLMAFYLLIAMLAFGIGSVLLLTLIDK
jgi:hypothetical protein